MSDNKEIDNNSTINEIELIKMENNIENNDNTNNIENKINKQASTYVDAKHKLSWHNLSWEIDLPKNYLNPFSEKYSKKIFDNVTGEVTSYQVKF
mmetsp:Transcript_14294/g.12930  ORF Transcript_14294/g.12930 Transcript_14294/m.12930 type:complete len:95 (-) Transcript_14294:528-812(-)